jgi:hypothetical protein
MGPNSLSIPVYRPDDLTAGVHSFLGTYKNEQALKVARELDSLEAPLTAAAGYAVCPGSIETPGLSGLLASSPAGEERKR